MSEPPKTMWVVEYHNDTGHDDESFYQWWGISNGETTFKSDDEDAAIKLCTLLNEMEFAV